MKNWTVEVKNPMEHSEYGTMVVILKIALRKQVELSWIKYMLPRGENIHGIAAELQNYRRADTQRKIFVELLFSYFNKAWVLHTEVYFEHQTFWHASELILHWSCPERSRVHTLFFYSNGNNSVAAVLMIRIDIISVDFFHTLECPCLVCFFIFSK